MVSKSAFYFILQKRLGLTISISLCPEGHSDTVPADPPSLRVEAVESIARSVLRLSNRPSKSGSDACFLPKKRREGGFVVLLLSSGRWKCFDIRPPLPLPTSHLHVLACLHDRHTACLLSVKLSWVGALWDVSTR